MQDYMPYEEEGWKRRFEMTIPILLLLLVLIILAWRLDWLCGIPGIGAIACTGSVTNILLVGDDANIRASLDEMRVSMAINYEVFDETDIKNLRDASYLDKYNLIILTEKIGSKESEMPSLFRNYLSSYLSKNGKMIMYGVAGSTDPAEPSADGWKQANIGNYIPVVCKTGICNDQSKDTASISIVSLKVKDIENPMVREFGTSIDVSGTSLEYALVNVKQGKEILTLEVERTITQAHPALVEYSHGMSGKTVYFAYHPSRTPTIFKNAVKHLTGR